MRGSADGSVDNRRSMRPSSGRPLLRSAGTDSANSGLGVEAVAEFEVNRDTVIAMQMINRIIFIDLFYGIEL
jgi:hypothetical protein